MIFCKQLDRIRRLIFIILGFGQFLARAKQKGGLLRNTELVENKKGDYESVNPKQKESPNFPALTICSEFLPFPNQKILEMSWLYCSVTRGVSEMTDLPRN